MAALPPAFCLHSWLLPMYLEKQKACMQDAAGRQGPAGSGQRGDLQLHPLTRGHCLGGFANSSHSAPQKSPDSETDRGSFDSLILQVTRQR